MLIYQRAAFQLELRNEVWPQKAVLPIPKRCETPLLPFHIVPSSTREGDEVTGSPAVTEPWDASGDDTSLASIPSVFLHMPLSTSDALQSAG